MQKLTLTAPVDDILFEDKRFANFSKPEPPSSFIDAETLIIEAEAFIRPLEKNSKFSSFIKAEPCNPCQRRQCLVSDNCHPNPNPNPNPNSNPNP
jgi:hypothetical protein